MKKLITLIALITVVFASDLPLSQQKTELLKLKRQKIQEDAGIQKKSWISPLMLSISLNKNKDMVNRQSETKNSSIEWSQDLFRSGGIFYTIEQAKALGRANMLGIDIEEAGYLKQVYTLQSKIELDRLKHKQIELTLKNRDLDLFIIQAKYKVGSADISELNRITIDRDRARTDLIIIRNILRNEAFELKKLIGNENFETIILPDIPLISKEDYIRENLELLKYDAQDKSDEAQWKITRGEYLPKLTFKGSLGYSNYKGDISSNEGDTYSYGAVLSMPLDINAKAAVESDRLALLQTRTAQLDRRAELEQEYEMRIAGIYDYEEKISVADEMLTIYKELYGFTENQVKAGFKSAYELESLENSVQIQELEKELQNYNILIEKISLYFDTKH